MRESILALWVNGKGMSHELTRRILSLSITDRLKKADSGKIVFRDPNAELFDTRIFKKGQLLHFVAGWVDEVRPLGPYIIKAYSMTFPDNGEPSLTVDFQDLTHKLDKKQKKRKHTGKASQILKKIAEEHGLGYDIDSIDGLEFTDDFPLNQASYSDAALIQVLADRYGYIWSISNGNLVFKRPGDRQSKKRGEPTVLSYRINDCSVSSFDPSVKYVKEGKKVGGNKKDENIDFTSGSDTGSFVADLLAGDMSEADRQRLFAEHKNEAEAAVLMEENIGSLLGRNIGEGFRKFYHESVDSAERLISWAAGTGYQTTNESFHRQESQWFTRQMERDVATHVNDKLEDDPDAQQSIYDDVWELENAETTWATPAMLDEVARRQKAALLKTRELVTATLRLSRASILMRPGETVTVAGVGGFFSGDYMIKEVEHSFQRSGVPFTTSMKITRSRLGVSKAALQRIINQEKAVRSGARAVSGSNEKVHEPELDTIGMLRKVDNVGE